MIWLFFVLERFLPYINICSLGENFLKSENGRVFDHAPGFQRILLFNGFLGWSLNLNTCKNSQVTFWKYLSKSYFEKQVVLEISPNWRKKSILFSLNNLFLRWKTLKCQSVRLDYKSINSQVWQLFSGFGYLFFKLYFLWERKLKWNSSSSMHFNLIKFPPIEKTELKNKRKREYKVTQPRPSLSQQRGISILSLRPSFESEKVKKFKDISFFIKPLLIPQPIYLNLFTSSPSARKILFASGKAWTARNVVSNSSWSFEINPRKSSYWVIEGP